MNLRIAPVSASTAAPKGAAHDRRWARTVLTAFLITSGATGVGLWMVFETVDGRANRYEGAANVLAGVGLWSTLLCLTVGTLGLMGRRWRALGAGLLLGAIPASLGWCAYIAWVISWLGN